MGNSPVTSNCLQVHRKVEAPMRYNGKTSAIDCRGYRWSLDVILSVMARVLTLTTGTWCNLVGEVWNSGGSDDDEKTWVAARV
jgi:hypothetical protein